MPLSQLYDFVREHQRTGSESEKLTHRVREVLSQTWYLGFTAFGGPPAHFQIFHNKFVEPRNDKVPWIDEQTYQELFALCQALPGPASTKFLFAVVLVHSGWLCAILAFLIWSLPGAIGMFALSLGVSRISDILPDPVYAFLSGLNASTVGIVAVAAVQLAEKCIKDPLSRLLVIFGACAGLCYSALWYYPVLVAIGGIVAPVWDLWLGREVRKISQRWHARRKQAADQVAIAEANLAGVHRADENDTPADHSRSIELQPPQKAASIHEHTALTQRRQPTPKPDRLSPSASPTHVPMAADSRQDEVTQILPPSPNHTISVRTGLLLLITFFTSFIIVTVVRSQLSTEYRPFSLFANMYLAGTIIFGGGPVVIPLLREYVVTPGWVSSRDFLIGLAIIQAFPGPNFNFAVYLGSLAIASASQFGATGSAVLGAFLGYVGIFLPGIVFAIFTQGFWRKLRTKPLFLAILRGINATAVGLVFTAVYRLWEVGYLTNTSLSADGQVEGGRVSGRSLADEPWWVVVAVLTYAGNKWFHVPAAGGIAAGGVLGLGWWGAVQR